MADITIRYEVSPTACAGGRHYRLTATVSGLGPDRVVNCGVPTLENQPGNDELKAALRVITWLLYKKYLDSIQHAQARTLLDGKQIVLYPQSVT